MPQSYDLAQGNGTPSRPIPLQWLSHQKNSDWKSQMRHEDGTLHMLPYQQRSCHRPDIIAKLLRCGGPSEQQQRIAWAAWANGSIYTLHIVCRERPHLLLPRDSCELQSIAEFQYLNKLNSLCNGWRNSKIDWVHDKQRHGHALRQDAALCACSGSWPWQQSLR